MYALIARVCGAFAQRGVHDEGLGTTAGKFLRLNQLLLKPFFGKGVTVVQDSAYISEKWLDLKRGAGSF